MAEPEDKKRRREDPFGDPFSFAFGDVDREFERMRRMMDDVFRQFAEAPPSRKPGQPFVYGFSMRIGPDGKPRFQEFGNTRKLPVPTTGPEGVAREPLADVIEHAQSVSVTAEVPGVQKEDVQLNVAPERVVLKVDTAARKYYKEIALPCRVVPKTANATFNNGVLDLTIEREAPARDEGTRVKVT